jgi:hypothetical protein
MICFKIKSLFSLFSLFAIIMSDAFAPKNIQEYVVDKVITHNGYRDEECKRLKFINDKLMNMYYLVLSDADGSEDDMNECLECTYCKLPIIENYIDVSDFEIQCKVCSKCWCKQKWCIKGQGWVNCFRCRSSVCKDHILAFHQCRIYNMEYMCPSCEEVLDINFGHALRCRF